jgi:hypothetical protein
MTAGLACARNRFAGALADEIFVSHASPGGKVEQFCRESVSWGKPVTTLVSDLNNNLLALGARCLNPDMAV